jgi:Zn-finger nucleic acid-binding protein
MIHCPDCKLPLVTLQLESMELDYCANGHGTWLDYTQVEALLKTSESMLPEPIENSKDIRRCPRCHVRMRLVTLSPQLELDACPRGDGIWFDPTEIQALARAIHERNGGDILDDVFDSLSTTMEGRL